MILFDHASSHLIKSSFKRIPIMLDYNKLMLTNLLRISRIRIAKYFYSPDGGGSTDRYQKMQV